MAEEVKFRMNLQRFGDPSPLNKTDDAALAPEMKTIYERTLLERLTSNAVHAQFGQKKSLKKNSGKTVEFRRFTALPQANFTLTEGVTPTGQTLAVTKIEATVIQHGNYVTITDQLDMLAFDPILNETADLLGEQSGEYIDILVRDVLQAGTNVMFAKLSKYNGDGELVTDPAGTPLTLRNTVTKLHALSVDTVRTGKRLMQRNKVKPYKGDRSTSGRGEFVLVCHADGLYDLESSKKWIDVKNYQDKDNLYTGEVGKIYGVRVVVSDNAKVWTGAGATGVDVYGALMIGANAYGVIDISGTGSPEFIVKPIGSAGANDPLNQRGTSGWKVMFTTKILEELAILRIEHGFAG